MPSISFSKEVDVDVEIDYNDLDVDDLAAALISKPNYQAALDKAISGIQTNQPDYEDYDQVKELVENFRCKKPIESIIASIAYNRFGLVV